MRDLEDALPNWCENDLSISGKKESIEAFVKKAHSREHKFTGPFNGPFNSDIQDWENFTPIQIEILMKDPESCFGEESLLSFHSLLPVPTEVLFAPYDPGSFKKRAEQYPEWFSKYPNLIPGYNWEHNNWGVKWGASDVDFMGIYDSGNSSSVNYKFSTPWGPPSIFEKVSLDFPDLEFCLRWEEPGVCAAGEIVYKAGSITYNHEWEITEEEETYEEDGGDDEQ